MAPSSSRNGARVLWVVVHTAEGIRKASDLVAFFNRSANSSSHACADDNTLIDNCVSYDRAAWTLRNGNSRSDNLELCGFASWSRAEWLNNHQGMLNNAAIWIRRRCLARGIPIRKLTAAQVANNESGVIGHVDYTNGKNDGSHWDPGPGFPWDVVIARAASGGGGSAAPAPAPIVRKKKMDYTQIHAPQGAGTHYAHGSVPPWDQISAAYLSFSAGYGPIGRFRVYLIDGNGVPNANAVGYRLNSGAYIKTGIPYNFPGGLAENHRVFYALPVGCQGFSIDWSTTDAECAPAIHLLTKEK